MSGLTASDVEVDSLNRIWVTSGGNIDIFNGTKWSHVARTGWPVNFEADQLFIRGKKIIVSDIAYTVLSYDGSTWQTRYTDDLVFDNHIDTLACKADFDPDNNMWLATQEGVWKASRK